MKNIVFFIFTIMGIQSCKNDIPLIDMFSKEKSIATELVAIDSKLLGNPINITLTTDYILLLDKVDNFYFALFNRKTGELIRRFGSIGRGPEELMRPNTLEAIDNKTVVSYDAGYRKLFYFSIDSLVSGSTDYVIKIVMPKFITTEYAKCRRLTHINSNFIVSYCAHPKGRLVIFNNKGEEQQLLFPEYPYDKKHVKESYITKSLAYQYNMKFNPQNSLICLVAMTCQHIEIYKVQDDKIKKISNQLFQLPLYKSINTSTRKQTVFKKESQKGFQCVGVTDNFIYTSFSVNKNDFNPHSTIINDYLLEFDWKGAPCIKYKLDKHIGFFAIDKTNNNVYAISDNKDGSPVIVKLRIP